MNYFHELKKYELNEERIMKIVRETTVVPQATLLDVALGEVFECVGMWPGKVFIRIWSDRPRKIRFADISKDSGHTYTYRADQIERNEDGQDYGVIIYPAATVKLGEPA